MFCMSMEAGGLSIHEHELLDTLKYVHKATTDLIKPPVVGGGLAVAAHVESLFRDFPNVDYIAHDRHVNYMSEILQDIGLELTKDDDGNYHAEKGSLKVDMWVLYPYRTDSEDEHVLFTTRYHNPGAPVPFEHFHGTPVTLNGVKFEALNVNALVVSKMSVKSGEDDKQAKLERERDMGDIIKLVEAGKVDEETLRIMSMYAKF